MWRFVESIGRVPIYENDLKVATAYIVEDAARIVAAMNAAEAKDAEIAALTYERDVFHSIITENDGPMTKTEELLDAAPEAYQRKLVRELCLSMASFIAEIDANSIDVASYLEQRLSPILMKPAVRALLDVVGKDARQLLGWKRPAEPARKAVCGTCFCGSQRCAYCACPDCCDPR